MDKVMYVDYEIIEREANELAKRLAEYFSIHPLENKIMLILTLAQQVEAEAIEHILKMVSIFKPLNETPDFATAVETLADLSKQVYTLWAKEEIEDNI